MPVTRPRTKKHDFLSFAEDDRDRLRSILDHAAFEMEIEPPDPMDPIGLKSWTELTGLSTTWRFPARLYRFEVRKDDYVLLHRLVRTAQHESPPSFSDYYPALRLRTFSEALRAELLQRLQEACIAFCRPGMPTRWTVVMDQSYLERLKIIVAVAEVKGKAFSRGVKWWQVADYLEEQLDAGAEPASMETWSNRLGCSLSTVHTASIRRPRLKALFLGKKQSAKNRDLHAIPAQREQAVYASDAEKWQKVLAAATPEERRKLKGMGGKKRAALIEQLDQYNLAN